MLWSRSSETQEGEAPALLARSEEKAILVVLGRKAWLFSDTPAGAEASARLYGLIETAKANGCEPYAYLRRVFTDLPKATTLAEIKALLPWNVARPAALSAAA